MVHPNRFGHLTASLAVVAVVLTQARTSVADAVFDFEFESFAVVGSVDFADDFEQGDRNSFPTSALVDVEVGGVTGKSNGALVLSSADGSSETIEGDTTLRVDRVALVSMPILNSGSGTTTVTGALSPFPGFILPTPAQTSQFAGVEFGSNTNSNVTFLGVMLDGTQVSIVLLETIAGTTTTLGMDSVFRGDATSETIVFELSLDQTNDSATARYSLDGGTSFVDPGSWDVPPTTGAFNFDQDLLAQLSASALTVPEPSATLLGAISLSVLAGLGRTRSASSQS